MVGRPATPTLLMLGRLAVLKTLEIKGKILT